MQDNDKIIVIVGPTASGKSDLANELAYKIDGEVVSADSMQIYEGMDIGTGKVSKKEQKVKHWGIDIVKPSVAYSAALFQDYSRQCFADIKSRNKTAILCGGTGFYVRAAIDDYKFPKGEQVNNSIREKFMQVAKEKGNDEVWNLLNEKDPKSAGIIHKNNLVRLVRALELLELGKSYSDQVKKLQNLPQKYDAYFFGLKRDPEVLKDLIDKRVDKMLEQGLVDEVQNLLEQGYRDAITASSAIGYKEIVAYLDGNTTLEEAINQIKTATKQYAKRQRTWFNKDSRINWIDIDSVDTDVALDYIIEFCDKDQ